MSDPRVTVVFTGNRDGRDILKEYERVLMHKVDSHMKRIWASVMKDWQKGLVTADSTKGTIALVTRDCTECETRVRVGVLISPLSPKRPVGERAYCAKCNKVTLSPVVEVRGLVVEDDDPDGDE